MQIARFFFSIALKRMISNIISPLSTDHFTFYTFFMAMSEGSFSLALFSVIVTQSSAIFLGLLIFFLFSFSCSQSHPIFHHQQHGISTHFFFPVKSINESVLYQQQILGKSILIVNCLLNIFSVLLDIFTMYFLCLIFIVVKTLAFSSYSED